MLHVCYFKVECVFFCMECVLCIFKFHAECASLKWSASCVFERSVNEFYVKDMLL